MMRSNKNKVRFNSITTAEALYRLFCELSKKDRLALVSLVLKHEDIKTDMNMEIPNKITLNSFTEDKSKMSVFDNVDELRKELLS